jgi:hypothetical protein
MGSTGVNGRVPDDVRVLIESIRTEGTHPQILNEETRKAQELNGISCNITDFGRRAHNIQAGEELTVATLQEGILIVPTEGEDG